jgi:hypothetical protein
MTVALILDQESGEPIKFIRVLPNYNIKYAAKFAIVTDVTQATLFARATLTRTTFQQTVVEAMKEYQCEVYTIDVETRISVPLDPAIQPALPVSPVFKGMRSRIFGK